MSLQPLAAARYLLHWFDPPYPPFSRGGKQRHLILVAPIVFVRQWVPRIAALVLLLGSATAQAETDLPVSWDVAKVPDLGSDGKGWGPAAQDDGRSYRTVLKGPAAVMKLPNWWNDSVRPPKGACYVLEVTFKDVVDAPVSVKAFGGIGSYEDRTELHRIGGKNDGQWKVAQVPASWDLLMLRKDSKHAELAFQTSVDLPISKILVRKAKLPADRIRWEAESRAWVAQVQAEKATQAVYEGADQTPVIPEAYNGQALVPFVRPYYEQIHPNHAPQAGEAGATIHLRMARNEYEPAAFGVYAQEDLAEINFSLSDLSDVKGKKLACEASLQTIEYALEKSKARGQETAHVWKPQRLWKAFGVSIPKGRAAWFYLTVKTLGERSLPGRYTGTVEVAAGTHRAKLPVSVEILPITLLTMDEAGMRMGGCVTGYATAGEMRTMLEHNHNMLNLWFAGVQPGMRKVGEKIELDFYYLDDFMRLALEHGQKSIVWFLGGNPNGYPETTTIERELNEVLHGGRKEPREAYLRRQASEEGRGKIQPEIAAAYTQWLRDVAAHAKEQGWPELIFSPFDEPAKWAYPEPRAEANRKFAIGCGPWIRDHFKAACALIHEAAPGHKVYVSMHRNFHRKVHGYDGRVGEIFIPDTDIICTNAIGEDEELGEKVRKAGKEFWQYGGGKNLRYGYGFWFGAWDSRGALCWAYNWGSRLDISTGSNWMYAWYSPFETILTPAYEEIREAWDDRRYLETAKAAAKTAGVDISSLIAQIRKETLESQSTGGLDKVNDFWEGGRSASKMDLWRKLLADKIVELTKTGLVVP